MYQSIHTFKNLGGMCCQIAPRKEPLPHMSPSAVVTQEPSPWELDMGMRAANRGGQLLWVAAGAEQAHEVWAASLIHQPWDDLIMLMAACSYRDGSCNIYLFIQESLSKMYCQIKHTHTHKAHSTNLTIMKEV